MTVKELIEKLEDCPQDMEVMFSYSSNDYWNTVLAHHICTVRKGDVEYSSYHRSSKVVENPVKSKTREVILIN